MVELKLLEFIELTGYQPGGHRAGYVQQVACRDADALKEPSWEEMMAPGSSESSSTDS